MAKCIISSASKRQRSSTKAVLQELEKAASGKGTKNFVVLLSLALHIP